MTTKTQPEFVPARSPLSQKPPVRPVIPGILPDQGPKSYQVGIIGGGQLAWMLGLACQDLDISCSVYAQSPDDPAVLAGLPVEFGPLGDSQSLQGWMESQEVILIESELTPFEPLHKALTSAHKSLIPSVEALQVVRDKLQQKTLFHQLGLLTAPWTEFVPTCDPLLVVQQLRDLKETFPQGLVLKWSLEGYDGKGVLVLPHHELQTILLGEGQTTLDRVVEFFKAASSKQIRIYGESLIPFQWEVAITMTRSRANTAGPQEVMYPLVISEQRGGTCFRVKNLASDPQLFASAAILSSQAAHAARRIGEHLAIEGTFALEFFVTPDFTLLVNEMAPRVHNSSHCSQVAGTGSQFHNHIRAATSQPLVEPHFPDFYGMTNLLGPEGYDGPLQSPLGTSDHNSQLYWYDKKTSKPRRKLGHVNVWSSTSGELMDHFKALDQRIAAWDWN